MPALQRVVIRYRPRNGELQKAVFEETTLAGALAQLAEVDSTLGPFNIIETMHGEPGKEKAYTDWKRIARATYQAIPFPQYTPQVVEGQDLSLFCPRCGEDIGWLAENNLLQAEIHVDFSVSVFELRCEQCGSDLDDWIDRYLQGLMYIFDTVMGKQPSLDALRKRFITFYQTLQRILADLATKGERPYQALIARAGLFEHFATDDDLARALGVKDGPAARRDFQRGVTAVFRHPLAAEMLRLYDMAGAVQETSDRRELSMLHQTREQIAASVAEVVKRQTEVVDELTAAVANLRIENLVLKGLPQSDAKLLAILTINDLNLTGQQRQLLRRSKDLKGLRNKLNQPMAGELLIRMRHFGRKRFESETSLVGATLVDALVAAYAELGIRVFSEE